MLSPPRTTARAWQEQRGESNDKIYPSLGDQCDRFISRDSDPSGYRSEERTCFHYLAGADFRIGKCAAATFDLHPDLSIDRADPGFVYTRDQHLHVLADECHRSIVWIGAGD